MDVAKTNSKTSHDSVPLGSTGIRYAGFPLQDAGEGLSYHVTLEMADEDGKD